MHTLLPFRVSLHEDKGDKATIFFFCMAESDDHAEEQAIDAYPNCDVIHISQCTKEEYPYAIHDGNF